MKCAKCNREINNTYKLNGKYYGYDCYKKELSMVLANKENLAKEKYNLEVSITIEILKNRNKLNDFLKDIIKFYENKGFLTSKQLKCIKLTDEETFNKMLTVYDLLKDEKEREEIEINILNQLYKNNNKKDININNIRLITLLKSLKKIQRRQYTLYKYKVNNEIITTLERGILEDIKEELIEDEIEFIEGLQLN